MWFRWRTRLWAPSRPMSHGVSTTSSEPLPRRIVADTASGRPEIATSSVSRSYFDVVGAEQTLQGRFRFALLEVYGVGIWAVDFAAAGVHEALAVGVLAHAQHLVTLGKNLVDDAEVVEDLERPSMDRACTAMRIDARLLVDDADRRAIASQFTSHCEPRRAGADNQDR